MTVTIIRAGEESGLAADLAGRTVGDALRAEGHHDLAAEWETLEQRQRHAEWDNRYLASAAATGWDSAALALRPIPGLTAEDAKRMARAFERQFSAAQVAAGKSRPSWVTVERVRPSGGAVYYQVPRLLSAPPSVALALLGWAHA